jgi:sugar O-acyltransferase (sialic acid O-acetyltransferase NeuD family)
MSGAVILGAGGHARVVYDTALGAGVDVAGFVDAALPVDAVVLAEGRVLGSEAWLLTASSQAPLLYNGLGANPDTARRQALFERWVGRGARFPALVHPSAVVGRECAIEAGAQVMAGVVLQPRVRLGVNVVVNTRASVDHDVCIEAHAFIAPGVVLCGSVTVGTGAFIGAGAILVPGVRVGAGAVVGAGSVVRHPVPDGGRLLGRAGLAEGRV